MRDEDEEMSINAAIDDYAPDDVRDPCYIMEEYRI